MHDLKWIRDNAAAFDAALARRGMEAKSHEILAMDEKRRSSQTALNDLQAARKNVSKQIGQVKKNGGDAQSLMDEVADLKERMDAEQQAFTETGEQLDLVLMSLPNILSDETPDGDDEDQNVLLRTVGTPTEFDFTPKEHDALGEALQGMDFETAAKLSGARFVVLKGAIARLERALAQFMINTHTMEHGYTEYNTPVLVREQALYGTGQLPKFGEDAFRTTDDYWLIPTSEVTLTNTVADTILTEDDLPRRMTAFSLCFRSEAGSAGRDTRGMIRQHQFEKVEMVSIVKPEDSEAEHLRMLECAENILKALKLPYRVMVLCSGDTGFGARKTYDLEVWLPGQNKYREISSCSNCGDFQARRMKARFKRQGDKSTTFVHTLNGSGLAVGRTLVAVLENYQQADGSIVVPEVLRPYMGGETVIAP
jgi:seryl-tRNA synthetase